MGGHRIRLAGPWQYRLSGEPGEVRTVRLPLVVDTTGDSLQRGFHAPSGLAGESELLVVFRAVGAFAVRLNATLLAEHGSSVGECAVADEAEHERMCGIPRSALKSFNELEFTAGCGRGEVCRLEEVWLLILESE